jgi:hypothetical protein
MTESVLEVNFIKKMEHYAFDLNTENSCCAYEIGKR